MNYRDLKWHDLRSFATSQGIDTRKKKKRTILEELDGMFILHKEGKPFVAMSKLEPFKGIKEPSLLSDEWIESLVNGAKVKFHNRLNPHPLFDEIKEYIPHLKAYKKIKAISSVKEVTTAIATLFMKYIETDKRAGLNLSCGRCKSRYYERMIYGYNKLAEEYGRECI
jgi:hypothetical protein